MNTDHVVMGQSEAVTPETQTMPLRCLACEESVSLVLPVSIDTLAVLAPAFTKAHAKCGVGWKKAK